MKLGSVLVLLVAVSFAPGRVRAEGGAVAVGVVGMAPGSAEAERVRARVRKALASSGAQVVDARVEERMFASPAPPSLEPELRNVRKHLRRAESALESFDLDGAERAIGDTREALEPVVGRPEAYELERKRLVLAVAIAHAKRNEPILERRLAEYAARFPGEPPPEGAWPPAVADRIPKPRTRVRGTLVVKSRPEGLVHVDGHPHGRTPATIGGLVPGKHRVVVTADDHFAADARAKVVEGEETALEVELLPDLSARLPAVERVSAVPVELARSVAEVAREHGVGAVFLCGLTAEGEVELARIEVGAEVAPAVQRAPFEGVERAVAALAGAVPEPPPEVPAPVPGPKIAPPVAAVVAPAGTAIPTWSWIGAGAGAAALIAGVGFRLAAVSKRHELDARGDGITQAEAYALRDGGVADEAAGAVLIGVGVAALGAAVAWIFLEPSR